MFFPFLACGIAALGLVLLGAAGPLYRVGAVALPAAFTMLRWAAYVGIGAMVVAVPPAMIGYARGDRSDIDAVTQAFFGRVTRGGRAAAPAVGALLLVDARHPGLPSDADAWRWLESTVGRVAIVATKIDKLARGQRIRALHELESVFQTSVLPVSAVTGEGLDELWKLIDRTKT